MNIPVLSKQAMHDPVASHLGYLLRRASAVMMAGLGAALAEIDLRPVEATIVVLVGANPGCIQSDLGRQLGIKRANMVPLITGLVSKGLLMKSPVDGRSIALSLTAEGEAACDRVTQLMAAHEARFDKLLRGHDVHAVRQALLLIASAGEHQA